MLFKDVLNVLIILVILLCGFKKLNKLPGFSEEKNVVTVAKYISAAKLCTQRDLKDCK